MLAVRTVHGADAVWLAADVAGGDRAAGPADVAGADSPVIAGAVAGAGAPAGADGLAGAGDVVGAGGADGGWTVCALQVRAHGDPVPARARRELGGRVRVEVDGDLRGVAPGQSLVLYAGTRVLGQATVDRTERADLTGATGRPDTTDRQQVAR